MKKVSLITLQNVPNYGSVLQCYATEQTIKSMGYNVETINYLPERMTKFGMLKSIKYKSKKLEKSFLLRTVARIIIFPSYLLRFKVFKKFRNKYLNMTKKVYKKYEDIISDTPDADIYCTGSDQVWNSEWNNEIDKALLLGYAADNKRKIAYAASFGRKELEKDEIEETKKMLNRYDRISLRESSGVDIVNSLGIKGAVNVVDPTLLLTGNEWRKISSNRFKDKKYILVYNLNRNKKIDNYAKRLSKKTGLKIIYLSYQLHEFYKKGKMICNPKVEDFVSLIDNAEYVISDSFHATAFSLNLNTQFIIVYPGKFSTRLQSLLNLLNLEDRVATSDEDLNICDDKIDYKSINIEMNKMRNKSLVWLKESLEE